MEQRARETKIKPRIFNFSAKPQQKISPFHSYPQLRYLIGCVYFGAYGVHSCPLLQTSRFLLLCSVGLPLKTQNERRGKKSRGHLVNYRWIRMRFFTLTQTHKKCKIQRSLQTKRCYNPLPFFYHLIYSLLCFAWSVPAIFHHFFTGESIFSCQRVTCADEMTR